MGAHAGVWICIVEWVVRDTSTEWGGFHGVWLITSSRVRLNVQIEGEGAIVSGEERVPTDCLAVHAHVTPGDGIARTVLVERDGWPDFPNTKVRRHQ